MATSYQVTSRISSSHLVPSAYAVALGGAIAGATFSIRNNLRLGSLFVDPYWIGFYVANFQDGFRRRALIGTLCRALFPHGISVITINILAFLMAFASIGLLMRSFVRLSSTTASLLISIFTFAFFASTLASSFIETAGDTLQIAFLVFLGVLLASARWVKSDAVRLILGLLLIAAGFMIHEASMFFLVPALPFLLRSRPRIADFVIPSLLLVALFGLSMHWSHLKPSLTYQAIPFPHNRILAEPIATPDFKELLRTEAVFDFGSAHNIVRFASKCLRLFVLLFAGIVCLAHCFPRRIFERVFLPLVVISFYNAPLWFIAHDWGRFLAYIFFFAIVVSTSTTDAAVDASTGILFKVSGWLRSAASLHGIAVAALFLLLTSHTLFSRITGIDVRTFVVFLAILFLLAVTRFTGLAGLEATPLD